MSPEQVAAREGSRGRLRLLAYAILTAIGAASMGVSTRMSGHGWGFVLAIGLLYSCALWMLDRLIREGVRQGYSRRRLTLVGYGAFLVVCLVAGWITPRVHG